MEPQRLIPGDSTLVENIVNYLKAKGIFDEFRHECLADVDTKSSCQNLSQRVDGYASKFLANETWNPELNKNELRNKLRRHIDESGMLAIGADHVVEQVINPKIHQLFLPKIIEVVHQYMKEQNEILNKKPDTSPVDSTLSENASDIPDSNKAKTSVSDPIADILSFSYSKTKPTAVSSPHGKTDTTLQKHTDLIKVEKKKEEKGSTVLEKNVLDSPCESHSNPVVSEVKPQIEKEKDKIKKEEPEVFVEATKKSVKEEIKPDKKKVEETKAQSSELAIQAEENKTNVPPPVKTNISSKKDVDKNKQKPKSANTHKSSIISSDVKKSKKESFDKSSEKQSKSKLPKSSKEASSPTKSVSSVKSTSKEEKGGEISKTKPSDGNSSKTSESSQKKSSKSNSNKIDYGSSKHKSHSEKSGKYKVSKSDKNEQNLQESSNNEKGKNILYSSSYDSSQGSDQEKSSSSSSKKERQKYFSKHTKKESSEKQSDKSSKVFPDKRHSKDADNSPLKKQKSEKNERFKETVIVGEAAKISSRSNSFGSTSSVSSSSNTSKDNLVSNSDEASENSKKDKKNKQKEKEPCHISKILPPPPPPPPPSSSLSCELTSSAEVSSIEDTQSSTNSENSSSEELSEQSSLSSDSEEESKASILNTLSENLMNSSTDDINDFYDIFLYSSSSSEFEGYGDSPDKKANESVLEKLHESDISVSSVHTSDLSSYDDELSDGDDFFFGDESQLGVKKRLTLKEAQELIQKRRLFAQSFDENKNISVANKSDEVAMTFKKRTAERSSSLLSSEDESSPSEPKRSLRRERKLNPRYASSEYTSIFNSRKETFITKHSSPYTKNQTPNSSPINEVKYKKEPVVEKDKPLKKNSVETRIVKIHQGNTERSYKTKRKVYTSAHLEEDKEFSDSSQISISDEMDSIMNKEKLFSENDESNSMTGCDELKLQIKLKPQSISNYSINSYPVKRKLKDPESVPSKRPCSRGSVDSSSSECVSNENKPFNSEKHDLLEEKAIRDSDIKVSDLTDTIKKDLFSKQRTNNNGDILGQKDIFPKHSHGKSLSTPERKTSETENSKELSAL